METFKIALRLLEALVSYLQVKQRQKYLDKVVDIKEQWYEEYNKPRENRNNAILDNLELELKIISDSVIDLVNTMHN